MLNDVEFAQFYGFSSTPVNVAVPVNMKMSFCSFSYCSSAPSGSSAGCVLIEADNLNITHSCFGYSFCSGTTGSLLAKNTNTNMKFVSNIYCSYDKNPTADTMYFKNKLIVVSNYNVSSCCCDQSAGIQGTDNEHFSVSYMLAANGEGWASVELKQQKIAPFIDHSVLSNNSIVGSYGVFYLIKTDSIQLNDVIISGNLGKGFHGGNVILQNCYYFSNFTAGISTDLEGFNVITKGHCKF